MTTYSDLVSASAFDRAVAAFGAVAAVGAALDAFAFEGHLAPLASVAVGIATVILVWRLNEKLSVLLHRKTKHAKEGL